MRALELVIFFASFNKYIKAVVVDHVTAWELPYLDNWVQEISAYQTPRLIIIVRMPLDHVEELVVTLQGDIFYDELCCLRLVQLIAFFTRCLR